MGYQDQVSDVLFEIQAEGDADGHSFAFTLVRDKAGDADWHVTTLNMPAPSLKKHQITMTIKVGEGERLANSSQDDRPTDVLLDEIDLLAQQKGLVKLTGYDGRIYWVRMDPTSTKSVSLDGKQARDRVYGVALTCYSCYISEER